VSSKDHELEPFGIQGIVWRVYVASDTGLFRAYTDQLPGDPVRLRSDTYDDLHRKASAAVSKQKVRISVPYAWLSQGHGSRPDRWVMGEATGIHGGSGAVLFREGNSTGQTRGAGYMKRPSKEDADRISAIQAEMRGLLAEERELRQKYAFDGGLEGEVRRALAGRPAEAGGGDDDGTTTARTGQGGQEARPR
jgi:hypothetical protein